MLNRIPYKTINLYKIDSSDILHLDSIYLINDPDDFSYHHFIKDSGYSNFYWQDGYGAFSVSPKGVNDVVRYIEIQEEHHTKDTFQDEFRGFLKLYEIEYDERYVWD